MIDEFESLSEKVSITKFCNDKNISKDSFYYFRKKFKKNIRINYKNNIFQEIKINEEATTTNNTTLTTGEVNITIGNINRKFFSKFKELYRKAKDALLKKLRRSGDGSTECISKVGVGKTGEGIPLEEVKPDVLKQIHPDDNGAYGYLPKEGTEYYKPEYDFTDIDWAKEMQNVRKDYLEASKQLEIDIKKMTSQGFSKEDIAKYVVDARNQQKVTARANMTAEERVGLEARNIKKYGNLIGPTAEGMFNNMKESYLEKGLFESDEQIWRKLIEKSMVKDDVINTLLGLIHIGGNQ